MRNPWFLRPGIGLWVLSVYLAMPAIGAAQAAAPEAGSSDSSGILAVIGGAALIAAGIYFWVRDDSPTPTEVDDPRTDETAGDEAAEPGNGNEVSLPPPSPGHG